MKVTKETNIKEAVEKNPRAENILYEVGLGCAGCAFNEMETIEEGLRAHGIDDSEIAEVLEKINCKNNK